MVYTFFELCLIEAFDVVGELAFGKKFGFLEEGRDIGWMAVLEDITLGNTWVGEVPYMTPIVRHPLVQNLVPRFRKQTAALGRLAVFAKSCVSSRLDRGSGDRKDMLTYTLEAHRKRPDVYTQRDLTSDAYTIVFAGSETTAIVFPSLTISEF
jgi:Cytochrome P450